MCASTFLLFFSQRLAGPRRRVPIMKHSHIVRVTRLSHPEEFEFAFRFDFDFEFVIGFRLGHPKDFDFLKEQISGQ
jgi:hypothetical protein